MPKELTTTSYAILGLLAIKPWSTYELAQQMQRSLHNFWPRAESKLYEEPKVLVAHGLATASKERTGKRPRTVYRITGKGRRALRRWLEEPGEGPSLEFEALLKVFFAEHGSKQGLLAQIDAMSAWAHRDRVAAIPILREYVDGGGPFPERLPLIRLMVKFLSDRTAFIDAWAHWAREEVETWPEQLGPDVPAPDDVFRAALEEAEAHVGRNGDDPDRGEP